MRFLLIMLCLLASRQLLATATVLVEVLHAEQVNVTLKDAALSEYLVYEPLFDFPEKTTFGLDDGSFTLLEVEIDKETYYLYMKGSFITIDLVSAKIKSDAYFLFKKKEDFFNSNVNGKWLLHLFEIEAFYKSHLSTIDSLIDVDDSYGKRLGKLNYWDKKSARKLMGYIKKEFASDQDFKLKFNSPSYIAFAKILYQINYQFTEKDIQNYLSIEEQIENLETTISPEMNDAVLLIHFFRPSVPLVIMENAIHMEAVKQLDTRVFYAANEIIKRKTSQLKTGVKPNYNWLFGFDVDEALSAFFAKQELKKPSLVIFWTTFGSLMDYEYSYLRTLYKEYGAHLNFVFVCVNAFDQEQKAKAIVYREQLNGYHLFPKSADAFWKSEWKFKKINSLPFYVLVDSEQQLIDAIEVPLDHAPLVGTRIKNVLDVK